jgi:ParB/RepB/Spo0J family partition protein
METIDRKDVDPNELEIDPVNERVSNVDPHSGDGESLQESIEEMGVIEPVVIREVEGTYKVIAGQRRTLAAQAASGVDEIPARVVDVDDSEAKILSITENAEQFRKDVPKQDRANIIKSLMEEGYTNDEIADKMGISGPTVSRWVEPATDYWEGTDFEPDDGDNTDESILEDISLKALKIIRKNTESTEKREEISKKVISNNITNKSLTEADTRSSSQDEFISQVDQLISEQNSDVTKIRQEVYIKGENAEKIDEITKERGINRQEVIESILEERIVQIDRRENNKWINFNIDDDTAEAIDKAIGERDIPHRALAEAILKKKLSETGYMD